jgi:hypothetical protein
LGSIPDVSSRASSRQPFIANIEALQTAGNQHFFALRNKPAKGQPGAGKQDSALGGHYTAPLLPRSHHRRKRIPPITTLLEIPYRGPEPFGRAAHYRSLQIQ